MRTAVAGGIRALAAVMTVTAMSPAGSVSGTPPTDTHFVESFDGAPPAPTPWNPPDWDVTVHSRDVGTFYELEPMHAAHGATCGAPPETHPVSSYPDAVFQCRDHVMTAINAEGYGLIYLTPPVEVDFSGGEAIVRVDVSTLRTSHRDWWDVWITPFDLNQVLPLQDIFPDLNGHPREGVNVRLDFRPNNFILSVYRDAVETIYEHNYAPYDDVLEPDAARRDTFELRISQRAISFGMPAYDLWWYEDQPVELDWTRGVVQFGHHSYNPLKDCELPEGCHPNTWHWDNVEITPAVPFTMIKAEQPWVGGGDTVYPVKFPKPAPAGSMLRFAGIGDAIDVSFDGGTTWQAATTQWHSEPFTDEHARSYWMPAPEGTDEILFRGTDWWADGWQARDIALWSETVEPDS